MEGTSLIVLNVLPDGQIIDPLIQYPLYDDYQHAIVISRTKKFLVVGSGDRTSVFQVQNDGTISQTSYSTTGSGFWVDITPDEFLVLAYNIYELSTAGQLNYTGNIVLGTWGHINPLGNPVLTNWGGNNVAAQRIDYVSKTVSTITTIQGGPGMWEAVWTPDGSLALVIGPTPSPTNNDRIWVLGLDSTGSIVTTGQTLISFIRPIHNIAFNRSGTIALCSAEDSVFTLSIDTVTKVISDTGIWNGQPVVGGSDMYKLRITPDDRLAIVAYNDPTDYRTWLATAFLNWDGSLTWTGYRFPYDAYYTSSGDGLYDMELVAVYVTAVPAELWKELE
jgi:hypothetical protein